MHSPRFAGRTVARSWVFRLDREAHDPRAGISWRTHRSLWLAYLAAADAAIGADPVCTAVSWGSAADLTRARARGRHYRIVDCGPTADFFVVWL